MAVPIFDHPTQLDPLKEFTQRPASLATALQASWPVAGWAHDEPGLTFPPIPTHPLQLVAAQAPPLKSFPKSPPVLPREKQVRRPKVPPSGVQE